MSAPFVYPSFQKRSFNCPHCDAYSAQSWSKIWYGLNSTYASNIEELSICICAHCNHYSLWLHGNMILPAEASVPIPNADLPEEVVELYNEAKSVLNQSPRSAAALLRLAIEKLLAHLSAPGRSINEMIKKLVENGLNPKLQRALDILRVVGNNAVHAGQIDFTDTPDIANRLFVLINVIAEDMITKLKEIDELYLSLPENERDAIEKRDNKVNNA